MHRAIALLTFATVVFRAELLLLLGPLVLQILVRKYTTLGGVIKIGVLAGGLSVGEHGPSWSPATLLTQPSAATVLTDSYFWQRWPLWPELYGIYFNVIEGKSADWGVRILCLDVFGHPLDTAHRDRSHHATHISARICLSCYSPPYPCRCSVQFWRSESAPSYCHT